MTSLWGAGTATALDTGGCTIGMNCVANASLVDGGAVPGAMPDNWTTNVFGTSDATFSVTPGRLDGRSVTVAVSEHDAPADAKWVFKEIPVEAGQYFTFNDWYKASGSTAVYAFFRGGSAPFIRLASLPAPDDADTWTRLDIPGFFVPVGATSMTVAHVLVGNGALTTDDYALVRETPPVFPQGLVSITFDDAWSSIYTNALPLLDRAGLKSTQFINTDPVVLSPGRYSTNMSIDDVVAMQAGGHEIGAHSRSHRDLVREVDGDTELRAETDGARNDLLAAGIDRVDTFAYPYGSYDDAVRDVVARYFLAARTTDIGYNTTREDRFALKSQLILTTTTPAEVRGWIEHALANRLWLILAIHRVEPTLADCVKYESRETDLDCTDIGTIAAMADDLKDLPPGTVRTVRDVVTDESLWGTAARQAEAPGSPPAAQPSKALATAR